MSRAEKKNDMEDVQLTQEDIKILSDYSWDMTGYTSRFGYFYLGSTKPHFFIVSTSVLYPSSVAGRKIPSL